METEFRLARDEDLPAMRMVQGLALHDLARRQGLDVSGIALDREPPPPMRYLRRSQPELSWVAERAGEIIGFSQGFVCAELWFLSNLFVHPQAQSARVGARLLQRCVDAGRRRGGRVRAVCSSPELPAQALYARAGMIPRFPIFALQGEARALCTLPSSGRIIEPAQEAGWIDRLGPLDESVWGRRRDADHRFALDELKMGCLEIARGGELTGYTYYCAGQIGPLCAQSPRLQLALLRAAGAALAQTGAGAVRVWVPGINRVVLLALLKAGFRIMFSNLFMTSRLFGRFDRYLPSGGTLL